MKKILPPGRSKRFSWRFLIKFLNKTKNSGIKKKTGCIIQELYDTKFKGLKSRSCLHDKIFELYEY